MTVTFKALGKAGRLGNQLFQIASSFGLAHARGDTCSFPEWEYQPYFSVPVEYFDNRDGVDAADLADHIDERTRIYLQDFGLWAEIQPLIRAYFAPSLEANVELWKIEQIERIHETQDTVAVHVRRGDYVGLPQHFPLPTPEYYRQALSSFPQRIRPVIFSDDIDWCIENMPNVLERDDLMFVRGVPRAVEVGDRRGQPWDWVDLFLFASCREHVIANSTFSWWGAYLSGNKHPIAPARWYGPALSYVNAELMMPEGWIRI